MGGQPDADGQHGRGRRRGAADDRREQAGAYPAAGFVQRERCGMDPPWCGGVPPDAGKARPGCDHRGPGLPALPVAVPAELALSGRFTASFPKGRAIGRLGKSERTE